MLPLLRDKKGSGGVLINAPIALPPIPSCHARYKGAPRLEDDSYFCAGPNAMTGVRDYLTGRQRATRPSAPAAQPIAGDTNDIV